MWYDQTVSILVPAPPPDIGEILDDLQSRIERTRVLYEQYFMGIEKMEPQVARKDIARTLLHLQQQYIRNTGLRFRFNTMLQKWNIYTTHWNRILREIENGTYTRHVQKAARKAASEGRELPRELLLPNQRPDLDEVMQKIHDQDSWPGVSTGESPPLRDERTDPGFERVPPTPAHATPSPLFPPPLPPGAARAAPPPLRPPLPAVPSAPKPPPSIPGMSESDLHALHKKFVATRAMNGERAKVSYEVLVSSLAKQVPRVLEQPGAKGVRFEVAVQNGRAILKAIPTK